MKAGDLDNDGDLDILVSGHITPSTTSSESIVLYLNNGGFSFSTSIQLTTSFSGFSSLGLCDIDHDDDLDIVYGIENTSNGIVCLFNLGSGIFGTPVPQAVTFSTPRDLVFSDLDDDNDEDLLVAGASGLARLDNDGQGNFTLAQSLSNSNGNRSAFISDMNGDGSSDIITNTASGIYIYLQNAMGEFMTGSLVFAQGNGNLSGKHVCAADLDGDGDIDIGASVGDGRVIWFANDGTGALGPEQMLLDRLSTIWSVLTADLDGDGDNDMLSLSGTRGLTHWYRNDGGGTLEPSLITSIGPLFGSTDIADVDGDGDRDLVASMIYFGRLALFLNNGAGGLGAPIWIDDDIAFSDELRTADIDSDGFPDVLLSVSDDSHIIWYHNLGNGSFSPAQELIMFPQVSYFDLSDIDLDGHIDLAVCAQNGQDVKVYMNLGSSPYFENTTSTSEAGTFGWLKFSDVNGDGFDDLVVPRPSLDRIWIYPGNGTNLAAEPISVSAPDVYLNLTIADLDDDGDQDLAYTGFTNLTMRAVNMGGFSFETPEVVIADSYPNGERLADVNADGILDMIHPTAGTNSLVWRAGDGNGGFQEAAGIAGFYRPWIHELADMDDDGDPDLLVQGERPNQLILLRNLFGSPYQIAGEVFNDIDGSGTREPNEPGMQHVPIASSPLLSLTNAQGEYTFSMDTGTHVLSVQYQDDLWQLTTPELSYSITLNESSPVSVGNDFGFQALLDTTIVAPHLTSGHTRCGTLRPMWLSWTNEGTNVARGIVRLVTNLPIPILSISQPADSVLGNSIYWSFDGLQCATQSGIYLIYQVPLFGVLQATLDITTLDPDGNIISTASDSFSSLITCAYDPNDKQVQPLGHGVYGAVPIDQDWLTYTIRFQNTGTDTAENVMLEDLLSPLLDRSSLQILGTSHSLTQILIEADGRALFRFNNIMLPDSGANEPESHGFLKFRIRPLTDLPSGTTIQNTVGIYFDLNPPIITNTTRTTLVDCALFQPSITELPNGDLSAPPNGSYQWYLNGVPLVGDTLETLQPMTDGNYWVEMTDVYGCTAIAPGYWVGIAEKTLPTFVLYPNPARTLVQLIFTEYLTHTWTVHVVDVQGKVLRSYTVNGTRELRMERGDLSSGMYFVHVSSEDRFVGSQRFVFE